MGRNGIVLTAFDGLHKRPRAPGKQCDHPLGSQAERRHALHRVEPTQSPRGARADVDQPSPAPEALRHRIDSPRQLRGRSLQRLQPGELPVEELRDQCLGRLQIQLGGAWSA